MALAVILGGGESGYGSAVLLRQKGYDVWLSDAGAIPVRYCEKLEKAGIPFEEQGHSFDKILRAELIVKSPGIPDTAPVVRAAAEAGIPIISEIELAGRWLAPHTRTICITGSNGKTTTTTLVYEIMRQSGKRVALAGNIGRSLALQVAETTPGEQPDWYVIELSSFQLDGMFDFRADIALLLNITPDHLDRYDYRMENYVASKFRIGRNQRSEDLFIYNADDSETRRYLREGKSAGAGFKEAFSLEEPAASWYDAAAGALRCGEWTFPAAELRIQGLHNIANALAAVLACRRAGVPGENIASTLRTFAGVEHRMEPVAEIEGVEYINDSKATNVDAVWYALQAMTRPTVWIAGGTDKGNDYTPLIPLVKEHVKALVCMGTDNDKLKAAFGDIVPLCDTHSLEEAISACRKVALAGDAVLLSPACASFDLFRNYEDRGEQFKAAVLKLK